MGQSKGAETLIVTLGPVSHLLESAEHAWKVSPSCSRCELLKTGVALHLCSEAYGDFFLRRSRGGKSLTEPLFPGKLKGDLGPPAC